MKWREHSGKASSERVDVRALADSVLQDFRYSMRRLRGSRDTAIPAILTVALTVGLATAVWSVARSVLIRPFPFREPERLVAVWKATPEIDFFPLSMPELLDIEDQAGSVESVGGFTRDDYVLLTPKGPRWTSAFQVTTNLLDVVGMRVIRGRAFRTEDAQPGHDKVIVLSEAIWREAFNGDPDLIGRRIRLQAEGSASDSPEDYRVVGIVATELEVFYPKHLRSQMYVPRVATAEDRSEQARALPELLTLARLRPGVPMRDGLDDIAAVMTSSASEHKATSIPGARPRVLPFHQELVGRTKPAFVLLGTAAGLLLVIGCANVASLVLSSGLGRRREFAARLSLGCSRARLLRQLLTEHLLLASAGGLLGVVLAAWVTPVLRRWAPESIPRGVEIRIDATALGVAFALACLAWLLSGLAPVLAVTRGTPLHGETSGHRVLPSRNRALRALLIATQSGLVLALVVCAALLVNGIWRLSSVDLGFDARGLLVADVQVPRSWWSKRDPRTVRIERELMARLNRDPRFGHAAIGSELPFAWGVLGTVGKHDSANPLRALVAAVGEDYLSLLGVGLRSGRMLAAGDGENAHVVVVNEALQRALGQDAELGRRIVVDGEGREIVGVVGNVTEIGDVAAGVIRRAGLKRVTLPAAYVPIGSTAPGKHFLLCRTSLTASAATAAIRQVLTAIQPDAAIGRIGWLDERIDEAGAELRFYALVVGVFAVSALLLGAIGIYGTLSHSIRERAVEIGIRSALGASPARVGWTMARDAFCAAALGAALGTGVVLLAGRALRRFLFEVPSDDPRTLTAAVLVLAIVASLSAYLPARSISRVDPARVLRSE